jgi:hypothetical protein
VRQHQGPSRPLLASNSGRGWASGLG